MLHLRHKLHMTEEEAVACGMHSSFAPWMDGLLFECKVRSNPPNGLSFAYRIIV